MQVAVTQEQWIIISEV